MLAQLDPSLATFIMFKSLTTTICLLSAVFTPAHANSSYQKNSNHIFNAIHSSMRQWGSSLHHNGMSFFIAEVPAYTQLYHGRGDNSTPPGLEWVAFEAEHALMFAFPRLRRPPHPPPHRPPPSDPSQQILAAGEEYDDENLDHADNDDGDDRFITAYLQTYQTKKAMRFLYVDGTSAGKSDKGTLDSQDYLLLSREDHTDPFWEIERAKQLCAMVENEWQSQISGILRMEAGFEIIMCNFTKSLDLVYQTAITKESTIREPAHFAYMRAMSSRYHGIGEGRVKLDYEHMVTAYETLEMPMRNEQHRLNETSDAVLKSLRDQVTSMVLHNAEHQIDGMNWQAVADMITGRWSDWLQSASMDYFSASTEQFEAELAAMLRPFTSDLAPNMTAEGERCSRQHLTSAIPRSQLDAQTPSLAQQAVTNIAERICGTLVMLSHFKNDTLEVRVNEIRELVHDLQWTTFKECRGCAYNEVCMVAAWPFGEKEDHWNPSCKNETRAGGGSGYWRQRRWGPFTAEGLSMHGRVPL